MTLLDTGCDANASGAETAKWEVLTAGGKTLKLCGHHVTEHCEAILDQGGQLAPLEQGNGRHAVQVDIPEYGMVLPGWLN